MDRQRHTMNSICLKLASLCNVPSRCYKPRSLHNLMVLVEKATESPCASRHPMSYEQHAMHICMQDITRS